MSTDLSPDLLNRPLELDPQVSVRPEPFGALAYHHGNRRLVFLKHPDLVTIAHSLAEPPSLAAALMANGIEPSRWPSFASAFRSLQQSEVVRER